MIEKFKQHSDKLAEGLNNAESFHESVQRLVSLLKERFEGGNKVLIAGNGGSAAESLHFSDEMLGKYRDDRKPYPVVSLVADTAAITCIGNDYGFEHVFRRQVEALGNPGDIFIGLTTSGNSKNILLAAEEAKKKGLSVVAFMGQAGALADLADIVIASPSDKASIVQEFHLHAIHLICEAFEN